MDLGFGGEVAALYAQYRRGYPPEVVETIADAFRLGDGDTVLDLGCGTGQLSLALASRVRAVIGMDPEPDMLMRARQAAEARGVQNAAWMLGADHDVPIVRSLLGERGLGAVTIATAVHWMDRQRLFDAVRSLVRPGGGLAVITNGAPLWLQQNSWSPVLRACLEDWLGEPVDDACQTDETGRRLNAEALTTAGYAVTESVVSYDAAVTVDQIAGGVFSALPVQRLPPPEDRQRFTDQVETALRPLTPLIEQVRVSVQLGLRIQ